MLFSSMTPNLFRSLSNALLCQMATFYWKASYDIILTSLTCAVLWRERDLIHWAHSVANVLDLIHAKSKVADWILVMW